MFVFYVDEVVVDDDVEESNSGCHENDFIFENIYEIKEGLFNSLVEEITLILVLMKRMVMKNWISMSMVTLIKKSTITLKI